MSDEAFDAVVDIGDRLCRDAVWFGGQATWFGDTREMVSDDWEVVHRSLDGDLYGGTAGIAVFLTRLWSITHSRHLKRAAYGAIAHAAEWCRITRPDASFYGGSTGVACAMAEAGTTFGDDELLLASRDLTLDALEHVPVASDIIAGRAGVILALLYLGRTLPLAEATVKAVEIGDSLAVGARRIDGGGVAWDSGIGGSEPPLCGFAHGASGIAHALEMLSRSTGDRSYRELAAAAATYERSWYRRDEGNWPDLREFSRVKLLDGESPSFPTLWCHGAVGIGLVRLSQFEATGRSIYAAEAGAGVQAGLRELAVVSTQQTVVDGSVCHGVAGIAELLLEAGRVFAQPMFTAMARECVSLLTGPGASGQWPSGVPGGGENPSLMLGLAGIGLVLLRAAEPSVAPVGLLYSVPMEASRLVVQLCGDTPPERISERIAEVRGVVPTSNVVRVSRGGRVILRVPGDVDVDTALTDLNALPFVEYAESDVIDHPQGDSGSGG